MSAKWPLVSLGELLRLERRPVVLDDEKEYREIGIYCFGKGIFHKRPRTGFEVGNKDLFALKKDDLILQITFAWEGAVAVVSEAEEGMYGSTRYPTFRVDQDRCLPKFLQLYFRTRAGVDQLVKISPGSAGRNRVLSLKRIPEVMIPLPPLEVQQRLVARIQAVAALVAEAQALRKEAVEEAEGLMTAVRRKLYQLPLQGGYVAFGELMRSIENGWSPACESRPAGTNEWGVLKLGAVSFGTFNPNENKTLPPSLSPKLNYEIREGDFLMSRANTAELVGACAIVPHVRPRLMLCDKIFRIALNDRSLFHARWVEHALKSPLLREQISKAATGTSPTMKNISKEKILGLRLPQHDSIAQRRIVHELDALQVQVDALKALQAETQAELDGMMAAVLNEAFNGRLAERAYEQPKGVVLDLPLAAEPAAPYGTPRTLGWIDQVTFNAWMVHVANKDKTFGRTKAEKVEHLIESVLGNDHGRNAVRKAAGPIDWDRRLEIEEKMTSEKWAWVEAKELKDGGTMYLYHTGPEVAYAVRHVEQLLGAGLHEAERIVKIMRPLNTEACEVRATLYAAWNDLIRAKKPHADADIIKDAYAWHPKKREIPEAKWLAGLKWLRDNELVPTGKARTVKAVKPH